jgi:hypothetical protein
MIPKYLFAIWLAIAPKLGNHLWQSTLFAVMTGLLTLLCERTMPALAIGSGWQRRRNSSFPFRCWSALEPI